MVETARNVAGIVSAVLGVGQCFMRLFNHKSNLRNLKGEVDKLEIARGLVERKVEDARNNVEEIEKPVEKWVENVRSIVFEADTLIEEKANIRCFNLKARYSTSRKASKMVEEVARLLQQKEVFGDQISHRIIHEDIRLKSDNYDPFESRESTLNGIVKALNEPNVNMVGIYGMGGVGKTTLVKEVAEQVKKAHKFDELVFTEVTEAPDIKKIQDEIAGQLGVDLANETEAQRPNKLSARLKDQKKKPLILDNVWVDNLDFEKIGIPTAAAEYGKLLITTRDLNVLNRMGPNKAFPMETLKEDEAWSMFKKMTGLFRFGETNIKWKGHNACLA